MSKIFFILNLLLLVSIANEKSFLYIKTRQIKSKIKISPYKDAENKYNVSCHLLAAIHTVEYGQQVGNGNELGVRGLYRNTSFKQQLAGASKIINRLAQKKQYNPMKPDRRFINRIGKVYCPPTSRKWSRDVWIEYNQERKKNEKVSF